MKKTLENVPLTALTLCVVIIKAFTVGIGFAEAIAIPLILLVHYGRQMLPIEEDSLTSEESRQLLKDVDNLKAELNKIRLRVGFSPESKNK